jgi:hypothetical protein
MTTSLLDADSLLAIDVGEITTRAVLFDVVEGKYRFLAVGTAPSTAGSPYFDIGEGIRLALDRLEEVTGRKLMAEDEHLLMPEQEDGSGVDTFIATLSAGAPLKVLAIGLLEDITVESARHLATTTYAQVVETLSLNDRRKLEARVDAILGLRPDVIIIAGGTENGASQSILRLLESVRLACQLLPKEQRPEVLYAGNQAMAAEVRSTLENLSEIHVAPNIRPTLEVEQLDPAQNQIASIFRAVRTRQIPGAGELDAWTGKQLSPTATAFGRIIRFLSKVYDPAKGVLGIDVGASATTVAAAFVGELTLGVYPHLGLGKGLPELLDDGQLGQITRWLPLEVSEDYIRDYIYNKTIYPASIPGTAEELAIEQALARQVIQTAVNLAAGGFPKNVGRSGAGNLPWFEPVVAAGSVLSQAPSPAHSMLILLDALKPTGVTTLVLDQSNLAAPLGAAAAVNPILVVQVLESSTFLSLGTVIAPVANVRPGTPILRLRVVYESGDEVKMEIKQGALEVVPLAMGQSARLHLQPLHRADVGMGGPGRGGNVRVVGGALGVIIDGRGRPLRLPEDSGRRRELFKKWIWTLGG